LFAFTGVASNTVEATTDNHTSFDRIKSFDRIASSDLSFYQALHIALRSAPEITGRQATITAAEQAAIPAGALPDPKLSLGINNMPVEGENKFSTSADFMTMRQLGVMQEFPNAAKRRARVNAAQSTVALAQTQLQLEERSLLNTVASNWITLRGIQQQLLLLEALDRENTLLAASHNALHTAKTSMVMSTLVPEEEAIFLTERRDELERQATRAQSQLSRWLGDTAKQPLTGTTPNWQFHLDQLHAQLNNNPELSLYDSMTQKMDAEVAEARAGKRPDWAVEVMYGDRGYPAEDMVSLKLTVDLPVFSRSRQTPRITSKLAQREQLESERDAKTRALHAELDADYADFTQLTRARDRQRDTLIPLAEKKVTLIQTAWQGGQAMALSDVIHARQERIEAQLKMIALQAAVDQTAAQLYFRYAITQTELDQLKQAGNSVAATEVFHE